MENNACIFLSMTCSMTRNYCHFRWCNLGRRLNKWNCISNNSLCIIFKCLQIMYAKYYELRYMFFKNCTSSKLGRLLDTASKFVLFSVTGLSSRQKVNKKQTYTWKMKHANSILACFGYFCQMSSKFVVIISSYTLSKLVHFFWDTQIKNICDKICNENIYINKKIQKKNYTRMVTLCDDVPCISNSDVTSVVTRVGAFVIGSRKLL